MSHLVHPLVLPLGGDPSPHATPTDNTPLPDLPVLVVIPTAPNMVLMVAENVFANLRRQQPSNLQLPSLYKRAYLVAYETDEVAVIKP